MFKRVVSFFMALIIFTFVLIPPDSIKGASVAVGAELGTQLMGVVLGALGVESLTSEEVLELALDVYENSPARPILDTMAVVSSPELANQYIEAYADDFQALFDTVKDYISDKFFVDSESDSPFFSTFDSNNSSVYRYCSLGGYVVPVIDFSSLSASVTASESIPYSLSLPFSFVVNGSTYSFYTDYKAPSSSDNRAFYTLYSSVNGVSKNIVTMDVPVSSLSTYDIFLYFAYDSSRRDFYAGLSGYGVKTTGLPYFASQLREVANVSSVFLGNVASNVSYNLSSSNAFSSDEYISDVFENLNNSSDYVDEDKKTIVKVPDVLPDSIDLTTDLSDVFERPLVVVEPTAMPTEMPTAMPTEIPDIVVPPVEDLDGVFGWLGGFFNNLLTLLQNALLWFAQVLVGSGEINLDKFKLNAQALAQTYPLSIPFDLLNCFKLLVAEPKAPVFVYDFTEAFSSYLSTPVVLSVNMGDGLFAPVYKVFRWFEFAAFVVSLISVTRNLVRG